MSARKARPRLVEGLAAGVDRADVRGMADTLGRGLVRVSDVWLPRGQFAVPQPCPNPGCGATFTTKRALGTHLRFVCKARIPRLENGQIELAVDTAMRTAVQQAMNGTGRGP